MGSWTKGVADRWSKTLKRGQGQRLLSPQYVMVTCLTHGDNGGRRKGWWGGGGGWVGKADIEKGSNASIHELAHKSFIVGAKKKQQQQGQGQESGHQDQP